jgi:hypothetical protein
VRHQEENHPFGKPQRLAARFAPFVGAVHCEQGASKTCMASSIGDTVAGWKSCTAVVKPTVVTARGRRIANPPQVNNLVDNLHHKKA